MEDFVILLNNVSDSYYAFVRGVLSYVKKKPERLSRVRGFIINNPKATTSEILSFISGQEDFYEDAAYAYEEVG